MMISVGLKKERPRKARPSNDVILCLLKRLIDGVKKARLEAGRK